MSFRHKNREAEAEEEDVRVSHAKDSQTPDQKSAQEQSSEQQAPQQADQESGQPTEQTSEEKDDETSPSEEEEEDAEPVPVGTTAEILQWVASDKDRAQRALDKEQSNDKPRGGLTGELRKILGE